MASPHGSAECEPMRSRFNLLDPYAWFAIVCAAIVVALMSFLRRAASSFFDR